jgi:hypothetical protein
MPALTLSPLVTDILIVVLSIALIWSLTRDGTEEGGSWSLTCDEAEEGGPDPIDSSA